MSALLVWLSLAAADLSPSASPTAPRCPPSPSAPSTPRLTLEDPTAPVSRSVGVGASYLVRTGRSSVPGRHGAGFWGQYDFHLNPGFRLGLNLAVRSYPGETATWQVGYGVLMRHDLGRGTKVRPFVHYGLLAQMTLVEGRSGLATSHDTLLGAGLEGRSVLEGWFVQAGYNLSWLRFFGIDPENLHYAHLTVGRAFSW